MFFHIFVILFGSGFFHYLGTDHYFLSGGGGGTFFVKKLFASFSWLKKLSAQGYEGEIVYKAKGIFLKHTDILKF